MSWAEVTENRIICHQGELPKCGVCGCAIPPKADIGRSYGGVPLCPTCSADVDANPAFKVWAQRQIDRLPVGEKP